MNTIPQKVCPGLNLWNLKIVSSSGISFYRGNEERVPIQSELSWIWTDFKPCDACPHKRQKRIQRETQRQILESSQKIEKTEANKAMMHLQIKEHLRLPESPKGRRELQRKSESAEGIRACRRNQSLQRESEPTEGIRDYRRNQTAAALILAIGLQNCERINSCCFRLPSS